MQLDENGDVDGYENYWLKLKDWNQSTLCLEAPRKVFLLLTFNPIFKSVMTFDASVKSSTFE